MSIQTIEQAEQYAAQHGLVLSPTDRAKIASIQAAERTRLEQINPARKTWADRFNEFYPRLLRSVIGTGETILTFSQTIITALGVPVVLVLLLIVEHHRVVEGILLFDPSPAFAGFAAAALVLLNLVLEFQVHYLEHQAGYSEARAQRWSLRIWSRNLAYRLGMGREWREQELSPATRYKRLLRLVTFTILALALVGSMRTIIAETEGAWYTAIVTIASESSLLLMLTWVGGLLFAAAAVLSAQGLSRYVAIRCVEILAQMEAAQQSAVDPHAADVESAGARAAVAIVQEKIAKREERRQAKNPTQPAAEPDQTEEDTQEAAPVS